MIPQGGTEREFHGQVPPAGFDGDGFLTESGSWTPALAERLAREAGIDGLTPKHWEVIHLVRERYFSIGALPVMRLVCRAAGLEPAGGHTLFGSCRSLWQIAGLPNPGEEAKSYMH
jgi:TusE/DsrC/DsvC family sulfur relay protein